MRPAALLCAIRFPTLALSRSGQRGRWLHANPLSRPCRAPPARCLSIRHLHCTTEQRKGQMAPKAIPSLFGAMKRLRWSCRSAELERRFSTTVIGSRCGVVNGLAGLGALAVLISVPFRATLSTAHAFSGPYNWVQYNMVVRTVVNYPDGCMESESRKSQPAILLGLAVLLGAPSLFGPTAAGLSCIVRLVGWPLAEGRCETFGSEGHKNVTQSVAPVGLVIP